jgi:choline dehydrogenase-like flavoprotein
MFRDARGIEDFSTVEADLCIVGGGAAGITLALGVKDAGFSTVLVEAGGLEHDAGTQAVYDGTVESSVLPHHYLSSSRLRWFGGTTNHWGGHSVVINSNVFRPRRGVPGQEWPFGSEDLRPYYKRAAEVLRMRRPVRERWEPKSQTGLVPMERYSTTHPDRLLGPAHHEELEKSDLQVLLNASVTGLNPSPNSRQICDLTAQTLAGNRFSIAARAFVLATGAVENARLLLLPTETSSTGIGNHHDLVGRFFADHLFVSSRIIETVPSWSSSSEPFFTFTPELQDEYALPEIGMLRWESQRTTAPTDSTFISVAGLVDQSIEPVVAGVDYYIEALPDPENRVVLSRQFDPFGKPRTELRFRVTSEIRERFQVSQELLGTLAGKHGLGRVEYQKPDQFGFGNHHMHTTRMSNDPARGVVDANGKVHGVANLFVAGSSLFPSSGCGNPTFPLIALAARLSDHLAESFRMRAFDQY